MGEGDEDYDVYVSEEYVREAPARSGGKRKRLSEGNDGEPVLHVGAACVSEAQSGAGPSEDACVKQEELPTSSAPLDSEGVTEATAEEAAAMRREAAEAERVQLERHAEAAERQQQEQRDKRITMYPDEEPTKPDLFKCPRCFYHNYYPSDDRA